MPRQRSILREEAFGAIKTLITLAHTYPSVVIDRMNDYQATHAVMPRKRSVLREEAIGAIMMPKRLEHTNPSVRTDRMDDYLAIYHKTSDAQPISFVYEQSLGRGRFSGRKRLELERHLKGLITRIFQLE
jgi:hypothetical protein